MTGLDATFASGESSAIVPQLNTGREVKKRGWGYIG